MHTRIICVVLVLYSGKLLAADEHVACQQPNAYAGYSADALRAIARSCKVAEVADLFYHRASHIHQLEKYLLFEHTLNKLGDSGNIAYIDSYRIHIGMAEALLSKELAPDATQTLNRLNRIYERSGEIAELRFRGYDLIANRLQQWLREKSNI
ncbi:MAG: hypothetical protein ABW092_09390 [Candidatus Thiodiazotropha sp.]